MTKSDIAAIEELASKAANLTSPEHNQAPPPWRMVLNGRDHDTSYFVYDSKGFRIFECQAFSNAESLCQFAAHAITDIPRLTRAWREQQAEIAAISMLVMGRTENVHDLPGVIEQCLQERMEYQRTIIEQQAEIERLREQVELGMCESLRTRGRCDC